MTTVLLSNSADVTADYLESGLRDSGRIYIRLNTDQLAAEAELELSEDASQLWIDRSSLRPEDVTCVVNRRPRRIVVGQADSESGRGLARREWGHAIRSFFSLIATDRWINLPSANQRASLKPLQLGAARALGLKVPRTLVTASRARALAFASRVASPLICKPLSHGRVGEHSSSEGLIYTNLLPPTALEASSPTWASPVLIQEAINKRADLRVTVLDNDYQAIRLTKRESSGKQILDIRRDNMTGVRYEPVKLPRTVERQISRLVVDFGLRFAALDFVEDQSGDLVFLEINPNGQWAWLDLEAGANCIEMFIRATGRHVS